MAKLKRTYIELVKNVDEVLKGGEPELEKVWTPYFIPWRTVREGMQLLMEKEDGKSTSEIEMIEAMEDFIVNKIFVGQITVEDLQERLHAPNAMKAMQDLIGFVTSGEESDELRAFLEKKN